MNRKLKRSYSAGIYTSVGRPTSRKAREVGHPPFVSLPTVSDTALYLPAGDVGHPPLL